jgi:hypothetical protein
MTRTVLRSIARGPRVVAQMSTPVLDTGQPAGLSEMASCGCLVVEDSQTQRSPTQDVPLLAHILETIGLQMLEMVFGRGKVARSEMQLGQFTTLPATTTSTLAHV